MKLPISIALVATLAACGGGSDGNGAGGGTLSDGDKTLAPKPPILLTGSAFDRFASYSTAFDAYETEKLAQFHTAFIDGVSFPTTGTADFEGLWKNTLDAAGTPTVLIGVADMDADFAAKTFSGEATDFVGQIDGGATAAYAGTVTLLNGEIGKDGPTTAQNDLRFNYAGTLTGNSQVVELSGSNNLNGKFLQTPITGIEATGSGTATINGGSVTDDMAVYADRQ